LRKYRKNPLLSILRIFNEYLDFWRIFLFLTNMSIFDEYFNFWRKFRFLTKISILGEPFGFWPKFCFLTKILFFDQNFVFWPKFCFLAKILFFGQNYNAQNSKFSAKLRFFTKITIFYWLSGGNRFLGSYCRAVSLAKYQSKYFRIILGQKCPDKSWFVTAAYPLLTVGCKEIDNIGIGISSGLPIL